MLKTLLARFNPRERVLIRKYQAVFDTSREDVKAVLRDMAYKSHMFDSVFSGYGTEDMLIAEGERNSFLRLMSILNLSPEEIMEMTQEEEEVPNEDFV
jgi:hypothetical protein